MCKKSVWQNLRNRPKCCITFIWLRFIWRMEISLFRFPQDFVLLTYSLCFRLFVIPTFWLHLICQKNGNKKIEWQNNKAKWVYYDNNSANGAKSEWEGQTTQKANGKIESNRNVVPRYLTLFSLVCHSKFLIHINWILSTPFLRVAHIYIRHFCFHSFDVIHTFLWIL